MAKANAKPRHEQSLHQQISLEASLEKNVKAIKTKVKKTSRKEGDEEVVDEKTSKRILEMVRQQQNEIREGEKETADRVKKVKVQLAQPPPEQESDSDDSLLEHEYEEMDVGLEIDDSDQVLLDKFMSARSKETSGKLTLSEMIMKKLSDTKEVAEEDEVA